MPVVHDDDSKVASSDGGSTAGTRFVINGDMERPIVVKLGTGTAVMFSSRSPDREGPNEDAALVCDVGPDHSVLAIADGFGGHPSGADASRLALEAIEASVRNREPEVELRTSILNGFEMANETVRALGVGAATTLAVIEVQQQWVRAYHVGDSGILVLGQRGKMKHRTVDHSPTGYAVEAGLMNDREAMRHEERHLVSNMVGSSQMRIDVGPSVRLSKLDTVIMATDGLFDNVAFDKVVDGIRVGRLAAGVANLANTSQRRMRSEAPTLPSKPDDMTILAFRRKR